MTIGRRLKPPWTVKCMRDFAAMIVLAWSTALAVAAYALWCAVARWRFRARAARYARQTIVVDGKRGVCVRLLLWLWR